MNSTNLKIGKRIIGPGQPVFIIAELSGNHNSSFKRAKDLVRSACEAGVDAIKSQTYTPDTITIQSDKKWFQVGVNPAWKGRTLYDLYKWAHTPWEWLPELKKIAASYGVPFFTSVFDETAVDFMEKMGAPAYKIASFEVGDIELLKKVASTKKPVIISRGMANLAELDLAIATLRKNGASQIAVLQCVSAYPAKPEDTNLATMADIKERFKVVTGLSDHTLGISAAIAAVALGASVIEKHFTLRRSEGGPDAGFSVEPDELKELVRSAREAEKAIGKVNYGPGGGAENIVFKRSLFVVKDIKKGEEFTRENIRCIRPGHGLAPKFLPQVIGKKARKNLGRGVPLTKDLIS